MMEANQGVCDRCEYIKEERILLDACEFLEGLLNEFGIDVENRRHFISGEMSSIITERIELSQEYAPIIAPYIADLNRLRFVLSNMKRDALMFNHAILKLECKCQDHPSTEAG